MYCNCKILYASVVSSIMPKIGHRYQEKYKGKIKIQGIILYLKQEKAPKFLQLKKYFDNKYIVAVKNHQEIIN